jgi:aryl-alcohol dehydrogenase-like predicted oxidoreductase
MVASGNDLRLLFPRAFGSTKSRVSAIGLGCSRLGSILGPSFLNSERLIAGACDLGVNFFDTADIYGQGDSERLLGRVLPRNEVVVATKVGQRFPTTFRAIGMLKRPLAPLLRLSRLSEQGVRDLRSKVLPRDFRPAYLRKAVERSLKRLRRESVDLLFLHGPDIDTVRSGEALDFLLDLRRTGKANLIGISCDDTEVAIAALSDRQIDAIQCRLSPDAGFVHAMAIAAQRGAVIVAREIFGGVARPREVRTTSTAAIAVRSAVANPFVTVTLIGTTKLEHLMQAAAALDQPFETAAW